MRSSFIKGAVAAVLVSTVISSQASAESSLGIAGGVFSPWQGDSGYAVAAQFLSRGDDSAFRWGLEFQYRDYESEFFDVSDVAVQSYDLGGLLHWLVLPDRSWTPYVGARIGVAANVIDADAVESATGFDVLTRVGVGLGIAGVVGLEADLVEAITVFAEARAGADFQLTGSDDVDTENLGGIAGLAGIRWNF